MSCYVLLTTVTAIPMNCHEAIDNYCTSFVAMACYLLFTTVIHVLLLHDFSYHQQEPIRR